MTSMRMDVSGRAAVMTAASKPPERRLMTRAEIEAAVAAGVISAAVLDSLAKHREVPAPISA
jgi:hypothetical protein